MKYTYPAIFSPERNGQYSVVFPDIEGCFTCGDNVTDALTMAEDALSLMLYEVENAKSNLPSPSAVNKIKCKKNEFVSLVKCDTDTYRRLERSKVIKKTLTIPEWLNDIGMKNGVNFSRVLQDALIEELGIRTLK